MGKWRKGELEPEKCSVKGGSGDNGGRRSRRLLMEVLEEKHVGGLDLPRIPSQFSISHLA